MSPRNVLQLVLVALFVACMCSATTEAALTAAELETQVSRLSETIASLQQDTVADKTGTPVRGEDLPKPADVPQALWPNFEPVKTPNYKLTNATISYADVVGVIDVAFAADGTAYLPDEQGNVWRFPPPLGANTTGTVIARLPGRPVDIEIDSSVADPVVGGGKSLVVTSAAAGIFRVSVTTPPAFPVTLLTAYADVDAAAFPSVPDSAKGRVLFSSGIVIQRATGAIFFTDSLAAPPAPPKGIGSPWDIADGYISELYAATRTGRLIRYDPATKRTAVVSTGSWLPVGVVLSDAATGAAGGAEDVAVVCEGWSARLVKVPLTGAAAGKATPFTKSLPGYCVGLTGVPATPATTAAGIAGQYYVSFSIAITNAVEAGLAVALAASPQARYASARTPNQVPLILFPAYGLFARVDLTGQVVETLQDPTGEVVDRAGALALSPDGSRLFTGVPLKSGLRSVKVA